MTEDVLDNPARAALLGPQAGFAEQLGQALRYPLDVSPFAGLPDEPDETAWRDAAALVGPGGFLATAVVGIAPPADWEVVLDIPGVQLVDSSVAAVPDPEAVVLGPGDAAEMLALVRATRPGPFLERTVALGGYLGIRRGGRLVAMAGERMRPPGWAEISAVCTAADYRGQGLGTRLVLAVAAAIRQRGETPFLHTAADNASAIRLYESLGFRHRRTATFRAARVPAPAG
ncbi:MAG TPA: GNAT family N-acetyltransferase [Streptosporangiaceae bacterium]|nr:GNAT family N-acetyltransferase [Streptosporangiaceae bacterium]